MPPGDLAPGSGEGREDFSVYAPGIRFPIEVAPAFVNSQVWGNGGSQGPGGSQCDDVNYSYPWRDNYCENRQWEMPLCPAGIGHQGEDIRPSTCDNHTHWAVATVDGTITHIGTYSVYLTAADGTRYDFLHMSSVQVSVGQDVSRGEPLGYVSNEYGGTPTTIHLHFNIRQNVDGLGDVYVPPYMSLVRSYEALINQEPSGELVEASCESIQGWSADPDSPDAPLDVLLAFDGEAGDPAATEVATVAGLERPAPCTPPESCEHGFWLSTPFGLFDGEPHELRAYSFDAEIDLGVELDGSPLELECDLDSLDGYRRALPTDAMESWGFSEYLDVAEIDADELEALPTTLPLESEPELVTDSDGSALWLVDGGFKRSVSDDRVALAWRFDVDSAAARSDDELAELTTGPPLRARPLLLTAAGEPTFLLDDDLSSSGGGAPVIPSAGGVAGTNDGCGCRTAGHGRSAAGWIWGLLAALVALARRRP
ncbi:MAG: M23 family metallopeptidase [Deltaproteobacteria bacterium]|nr:M23 family metallopeptidase [Deltaproteobacteria bacterium]MBW2529895.1 M23 family metallopeptidase [Deltaproteobacteria bacterium]